MTFAKVQKNKAYFKRFQVKLRRRREGKTNYLRRKKLVAQEKHKYNSVKYRFVVRKTSTRILCSIVYSTIQGDRVICQADSTELKKFGISLGLTNYAAAYATGLLIARRLLKLKGLDNHFKENKECGNEFHIEEQDGDRRPFKCAFDIGIAYATRGNKVFGALKGICDGGIYVPHSVKKFPGYEQTSEEKSYNAEKHSERILGIHVSNYMKLLKEEDEEKYNKQFSKYIKSGINADSIESMYRKAHDAIRANPEFIKKPKREVINTRKGDQIITPNSTYIRKKKLTCAQRKERVKKKIAALAAAAGV